MTETVSICVNNAVDRLTKDGGTQVTALIAIRDEAQAQLVQLKSSMLPTLRAQIAALEAVEAKVGRKRGSKNRPKESSDAQKA